MLDYFDWLELIKESEEKRLTISEIVREGMGYGRWPEHLTREEYNKMEELWAAEETRRGRPSVGETISEYKPPDPTLRSKF